MIKDPEFIDFIVFFFEFLFIVVLSAFFGPPALIVSYLVMRYLKPAAEHHGAFGALSVYGIGIILFVALVFLWFHLVTLLFNIHWSIEG